MPDFTGKLTSDEGRVVIDVRGRIEKVPGQLESYGGTLSLPPWQVGLFSGKGCRLDVDGGRSMMIRIESITSPSEPRAGHKDVPFVSEGCV